MKLWAIKSLGLLAMISGTLLVALFADRHQDSMTRVASECPQSQTIHLQQRMGLDCFGVGLGKTNPYLFGKEGPGAVGFELHPSDHLPDVGTLNIDVYTHYDGVISLIPS